MLQSDDAEYERDHYEEDDADEELRQLEERYPEPSEKKLNEGAGKDAFSNTEPGLEEDKDFRKKLRRTENSKIDTKAAFPSTKGKAEQVDFRNLLKKSDGPGKKDIKSGSKAQVDFRANLKSKVRSTCFTHPVLLCVFYCRILMVGLQFVLQSNPLFILLSLKSLQSVLAPSLLSNHRWTTKTLNLRKPVNPPKRANLHQRIATRPDGRLGGERGS